MSYIVLARKYRPQTFAEVYAQEHVTEVLHNAITGNRIAHAYLFTGPRGVGKTSMARIMAKNLNCVEGPTTTPCNKCHNCLEITSGTSTDVIEIDGASNTGVDDVRDLQLELLYPPTQSKYKIYIIDEVHMLSKNAFNALLKTLEEPPENVLFIFATTEPHKVLATIISRCQRYDFKRIPIDSIISRLRELVLQEGIEIDNESMHIIARKADGSMRDALSLLDQVLSYCQDKVVVEKVREIFGLIPSQVYSDLLKIIRTGDNNALLSYLQSIFDSGMDLQEMLNNMLEFLRIVVMRKIGMSPAEIPTEEYALYDELVSLFNQDNLLYMMSILMQTRNEMKSSGNPSLIVEMVMLRFCRIDEIEEISQLISSISTQAASPAPVKRESRPMVANTSSNVEIKPDVQQQQAHHPKDEFNLENMGKSWDRIVNRVKATRSMLGISLAACEYQVLDSIRLLLKVKGSQNLTNLQTNADMILSIFQEMFIKAPRLEFVLEESAPPVKVEIKRKSLDDLKILDENLARYIEITDSKLN
jgi:DNA polymerase III subunit gamma/tau